MESMDQAVLGGGCFWCLEAIFQELQGVLCVIPGYTGGQKAHPTYEQVCSGSTGHAEVVQIDFDPKRISYQAIVEIFFATHNPTTLNQQGADIGTQYRSVIFYRSEEQKSVATKVMATLDEFWDDPIVTDLQPLEQFYAAETYHHNYYATNPNQSYCQLVVEPKVRKFRQQYMNKLRNRQ